MERSRSTTLPIVSFDDECKPLQKLCDTFFFATAVTVSAMLTYPHFDCRNLGQGYGVHLSQCYHSMEYIHLYESHTYVTSHRFRDFQI